MDCDDWDDSFLGDLFEAEKAALARRTEAASTSGRSHSTPGGTLWMYPDEVSAPPLQQQPPPQQPSSHGLVQDGAGEAGGGWQTAPPQPGAAQSGDFATAGGFVLAKDSGDDGCSGEPEAGGTPRAGAGGAPDCDGGYEDDYADDGEDYGERLSETDAMDTDQQMWGDEGAGGDGGGGDGAEGEGEGQPWAADDGLFWDGAEAAAAASAAADAGAAPQENRTPAPPAQAQAPRQADIRQWFGGVPKAPKRLVAADIRSFFGGGQQQFGGPTPVAAAAQPPAGGWKRQRRAGGGAGSGEREAQPPAQPRPCPFYKKISGTPFAVDAFCFGPVPGIRAYILTHFHSDHYMGLGPSWAAGPIYCTPVTARLTQKRLRVKPEWLRPVPLHTPALVEGFQVTFFDANHCPGAAVVTIRPAARPRPLVVHTGDFRAGAELIARPEMAAFRGCDTLYLDTTYCDERYAFPPQEEVLQMAAAAAVEALRAAPRTLVVVGAYAIGKERVYLSIAQALGCRIFVDPSRRALLDCMEWPELQGLLTDRPDDTPLHVLPIGHLNAKGLLAYLAKRRGAHDRVLGFRPTGWTHGTQRPCQGPGRGGAVVYPLPYSEHSSVEELRRFMQMVRPRRTLATVNVGSPEKRATMSALFQRWLSEAEPPGAAAGGCY